MLVGLLVVLMLSAFFYFVAQLLLSSYTSIREEFVEQFLI